MARNILERLANKPAHIAAMAKALLCSYSDLDRKKLRKTQAKDKKATLEKIFFAPFEPYLNRPLNKIKSRR
jgi:hypothetical protein